MTDIDLEVTDALADQAQAYIECRALGHVWDVLRVTVDASVTLPSGQQLLNVSCSCTRCEAALLMEWLVTTTRWIAGGRRREHQDVEVLRTRSSRPEGYAVRGMPRGASRRLARNEYARRVLSASRHTRSVASAGKGA